MLSEIGSKLATDGVGVVGTTLFEGLLPGVNCVALFARPGRKPVRAMGKVICEQPSLDVIVQWDDYETAIAKAKAVRASINNFSGTIGGTRYLQITIQGSFRDLGTNESRKFMISSTYEVMKEE